MFSGRELTEFLEAMGTDLPGLYLLGSLNRHITVHSQQCRAINLIHALIEVGGGLDGKSMAIVGAGFAGLTAAAQVLEKTTAKVALFDTAPRPLWLQDGCANRWLHPGIYDWPLPGSLEPRTSLPVLNWHADAAANVAMQVRAEWERIAARKHSLTLRLETEVAAITAAGGKLLVQLTDGNDEPFEVVVLAVGFGLEAGGLGRVAYWNDADGLDDIAPGSSVLVSGFGDGGLSDVLRLCLPDFRQDSLVELVRHVPVERRQQLVEWEEHYRRDSASLDECYRKLCVHPIVEALKNSKSALVKLTLVGKGHLYGQRSAILNRFLVSQLCQARGEGAFELVNGEVDEASLTPLPLGGSRIKIGGQEREFDHVLLRLGPKAAYPKISPLSHWKVGDVRRKNWYDMPQSLDSTRVPLWKEHPAPSAGAEPREEFLAYESSSRRWCLVVHPSNTSIDWAVRAGLALERAGVDGLNTGPLTLCSEDALAGEAEIKSAVRALCTADIVIADLTGHDPSLLFLLGIRAAVRRSVTIACTEQELSPALWENLPFNLKELNLVSLHYAQQGLDGLVAALSAGLAQSGASPRYLDLPVYDYIREDSTDRGTVEPSPVLLLRAFKSYGDDRKLHVESRIRSALRERLGLLAEPRVEAVIDQASPRLAGQRLYEAIRHWQTCVADLTKWRPNVMFELGVRLAAGKNRTHCLIDASVEGERTFEGSRAKLTEFLRPFTYDLHVQSFAKAFDAPVPAYIYETAACHFRTAQDHFGGYVDEVLVAAAPAKPHDDPLQIVDVRQLYARDNLDYAGELSYSSVEMRCAAWYYLADREQPHLMRPIDLLDPRRAEVFRRFQRLGSRLKTELAQRPEARNQRLRQSIDESMHRASISGVTEMAALLDGWMRLRADPPWKIDFAEIGGNNCTALAKDYEDQSEQLATLKIRLEEMCNPVCELPLQGIRSDLRRLLAVLDQFKQRIP
ncbi:MAG: hypothetical protein ACHQZS_03525 [Candidatus Binatales bacterium]